MLILLVAGTNGTRPGGVTGLSHADDHSHPSLFRRAGRYKSEARERGGKRGVGGGAGEGSSAGSHLPGTDPGSHFGGSMKSAQIAGSAGYLYHHAHHHCFLT